MEITQWIEDRKDMFTSLSDQVWELAEIGYQEYKSAEILSNALEEAGFKVERSVGQIPTAFAASYGDVGPIIAILGEYDALPNLSQEASPQRSPLQAGGNGHGCGHNLLGVAGLAAALAVKEAIQAGEASGTIRYYGCPAEENGSGKAYMVKAGLFNDIDLSLTWHPGSFNGCIAVNRLANYKVKFRFKGVAAHAAADPHNGRSALDAVELMNVGVNYLREHIIPEARVHYVITNGGGSAPNVVPPEAESFYLIRAPKVEELNDIYQRVVDIARGAALMTGTEVETIFHAGASNLLLNDVIVDVLLEKMNAIEPPEFTSQEKEFAEQIASTFPKGDGIMSLVGKLMDAETAQMLAQMEDVRLFENVLPAFKKEIALPGSSDVGDVSWVTPTGEFTTTCEAFGTPGHSWQIVAQSGMSIGHKGMLYAAKILALSAIEFMQNPAKLEEARQEFTKRREGNPYISPIPDDSKPPLGRRIPALEAAKV